MEVDAEERLQEVRLHGCNRYDSREEEVELRRDAHMDVGGTITGM